MLNFLIARASTARVIAVSIATSVAIYCSGNCCIISVRMAEIYHRAGIIHDNHCSGTGIFSIGNIMPDSIITGSINSTPDTNRAVTWVFAKVEMNNPNARASTM